MLNLYEFYLSFVLYVYFYSFKVYCLVYVNVSNFDIVKMCFRG